MSTSSLRSSGGTYTTLGGWQTGVSGSGADETAEIQEAYAAQTSTLTLSMTGHNYLITADASSQLAAPTYASATSKARITTTSGGMLIMSGTAFTIEKIGVTSTAATNAIDGTVAYVFRRFFIWISSTGTSGFSVNSNKTITADNGAVVIRGTGVAYGSGASGAIFNVYHVSTYLASTAFGGAYSAGGGGNAVNCYACVFQGSPTSLVNGGAGTLGGDENVSQDAAAVGTTNWRNQTGVFANVGSTTEDLSMAAGPYACTDRSGTIADLATDLKGTTRVVLIDAGCDYIVPSVIGDLAANLFGYYRMDEASGTRVDRSSNALDLTDNNTVGSTTGHLGVNCADFTAASSESLSHADNAAYVVTTGLSISVWIYNDTNAANQAIVGQWNYPTDGSWQMALDSAGALKIYTATSAVDLGTTNGTTGNALLSTGAWHHLVVTFDGTATGNASRMRLFLDGVEKEIATFNGTIVASLVDSTAVLSVGEFVGLGRNFDSKMEHLGLWSKRLINANVKYLNNSGTGADPTVSASSFNATRFFLAA